MNVSDNTNQGERLGSFFKNLREISAEACKYLAANVLKKSGTALDFFKQCNSSCN